MPRVASLFLPHLAIERLRRVERMRGMARSTALPDAALQPRLAEPIDDDPGACSVPRGGGWRPGARWARDGAIIGRPSQAELDALPAHQRPTMREMGRRSEHAEHPFKVMPSDEGRGTTSAPSLGWATLWGRSTVLVLRTGQRDVITAACPLALDLGLRPGMAAAHARALVADLDVQDADLDADRALLDRLALHAARHWTPTASVSGEDGLWLDLTGTTHLFGGEQRFCRRLLAFLKRLGLTAHIAITPTPGTAHALARYGKNDVTLLPAGQEAQALADLPLAALRLEPEALASAARFGLERIADLYPMPRGPLARRLGLRTVERLDQARGLIAEPIIPVLPTEAPLVTRQMLEPIGTPDSIAQVISDLVDDLVIVLLRRGIGARTVLLTAVRVDGEPQRLVVGASRATRDARHLKRMFSLRLAQLEPGLGIETMHLVVPRHEPLGAEAMGALLATSRKGGDLAPLVDQLSARAGDAALFRLSSDESDVPERAARRIAPMQAPTGWPVWKRPVRLLRRPELLSNVVALMPDHPPRRFTWRRQDYRVVAGDGPERIHGEWWRTDREKWATRDYFRVEAEGGERFWLFRRGDGVDPDTGDLSWHMHGVFG
ncbi:protein ImuB [Sphingobium xenophagum]|uniref:Protein ImuB n=1 Tax=Sphingobium xenophagum TaxID=121428 RepID=A0ABU1X085_SPHXE|nr:DNA polymerase Y family protein [Sphingobium xenophagum]MDR7154859.1 protein ImuB [Sphingobium xenophagum]